MLAFFFHVQGLGQGAIDSCKLTQIRSTYCGDERSGTRVFYKPQVLSDGGQSYDAFL